MIGFLSQSRRDYVLFHLGLHIKVSKELEQRFLFAEDLADIKNVSGKIVFPGSKDNLSVDSILNIDGLPILFPVAKRTDFFYCDERNNLVFSHDLLKSIFYLLSGYQEYENQSPKDALNRFSFSESIQNKLNCVQKPLVNYYLEYIIKGIEEFCALNNLSFSRRHLFKDFGFLLSHDIDLVDTYTSNYFIFKLKEVLHLRKSRLSSGKNLVLAIKGMLQYFKLVKRDNPYWNFDFLRQLERRNNFRSTFYFLDRGVRHSDAYYAFNEKRMIELYEFLQREACEIGLHGTVRSVDDPVTMQQSLTKLKASSKASIVGIRQHRLLWKHPKTAIVQHAVGLGYDTTLGFAAHEGFRNSYCGPFKLYDFENDKMLDLWEFPLNVMDVTLFAYRNYAPHEAMKKCIEIIEEVRKFKGIFTLLWHNSFFDEDAYPGVTKFYEDLLERIAQYEPENILGSELFFRLNDLKLQYE